VAQLLPAADLHVSPAPEGGPQAVLEAMAAGLPTVAVDVPDNRWLLGDREAGTLFPAEDAAALAAAIADLLEDAATAQRLGTAARQRAAREFSLTGMAESFCKVLEEAAASRAS
jgi:glycosyltransferase involved in cell wall biosynthesis